MSKIDFDDYATSYNELVDDQLSAFESDGEYFAEYKAALTTELVSSPPTKLLEYGCGIGRNLGALRKHFPSAQIHGCDISHASLEYASRVHSDLAFSTADELLEAKAAFDLVFIAGVLHHVAPAQRAAFLDGVRALSGDRGDVVIFEHNPLNPVTRHLVNTCPFDEDAVLLGRNELRTLLENHAFVVQSAGYTLFFPGILRFLRPIERFLRWLPLGGQYYVHAKAC